MFTEPNGAQVLDNLLQDLQQAEEGSRKLDILISFVIGETPARHRPVIKILLEDETKTALICKLIGEDFPRYTESLDAKLPGENVVLSMYSEARGKWAAAHKPANGEEFVAWASTEVLARRLAALKALEAADTDRDTEAIAVERPARAPSTVDRAARVAETPRIVRPRPVPNRPEPPVAPPVQADAATEDWDIRF